VTTESHASLKPEVRSAPYRMLGAFYEACDCYTICPCWTGSNPDEGQCTGIFAWDIEEGSVDGVDVTGLRAVSVSHHTGFRGDEARQRLVLLIDDAATQRQSDALVAALTGSLGGPLQELADLLGELLGVEHAPITLRRDGRLTMLSVGKRLLVEGVAIEGPSGRLTTLSDGKLSEVLGTPAEAGESWRMRVGLGAHGMELDLRGRSTMSGRFSYEHKPEGK
jgi:hypothetical protein